MTDANPRRITSWSEAEDLTIRTVIKNPGDDLSSGCAALIVFEGDHWMTLHVDIDPYESDEARLHIGGEYGGGNTDSFLDYCTPREALAAFLINPKQRELAEAQRATRRETIKAEELTRLRQQLALLEKAAP